MKTELLPKHLHKHLNMNDTPQNDDSNFVPQESIQANFQGMHMQHDKNQHKLTHVVNYQQLPETSVKRMYYGKESKLKNQCESKPRQIIQIQPNINEIFENGSNSVPQKHIAIVEPF